MNNDFKRTSRKSTEAPIKVEKKNVADKTKTKKKKGLSKNDIIVIILSACASLAIMGLIIALASSKPEPGIVSVDASSKSWEDLVSEELVSIKGNTILGVSTTLSGVLTIPDNVITIEDNSFNSCTELTGINFGKSVKSIGSSCILWLYGPYRRA